MHTFCNCLSLLSLSKLPKVTHKVYLDVGKIIAADLLSVVQVNYCTLHYHNFLQAKLSFFQCIQSVPKVIDDDEQTNGRITLGLFGNTAPKAVENFRSLCNCDKGNGKISGKPLCYKGSIFHRISELFCVGM